MRLTERQATIIAMVASGNSLRGVAFELDLKYATVRNHAHHACQRLGASTLAQAAVLGLWTGDLEMRDTGAIRVTPEREELRRIVS